MRVTLPALWKVSGSNREVNVVRRSRLVSSAQRAVLRKRAWRMRHAPTQTEELLWRHLSGAQQGVTFRRQVVLQGYIVDFYASAVRLVVEVDGAWHGTRLAADERRGRVLAAAGYRVLGVSAEEVLAALPNVLARIQAILGAP